MKFSTGGISILCASAVTHAAFVPTAPPRTKQSLFNHLKLHSTKPTSPLSNLQEALPDYLNMDKFNPLSSSATESKVPQPPTPPPFDPTNPEALIAVTKSFIATDFGVQTSQLSSYSTAPKGGKDADSDAADASSMALMPFYSSSLLSNDFLWVSANNLNDGRAGVLNKAEYLAAGRFFNLRKSFPDLEYRAHDFRVLFDEAKGYDGKRALGGDGAEEITVRFTTLTVGTFRGAPLRLRSKALEPNGKVMRCPPTSVSITYATRGENAGKIIKLVNDMVMDRQFGNTNGLSGIAGAAVCAGAPPSDWEVLPPFVSAGRIFARPMKMIQERSEEEGYLPPFPDSVMIQLAKGLTASNFGLEDPDLLSEDFSYLEPTMGPLNKEKYIEVFSEYDVRGAVPDIDYQFQNYRIDPYDPYRVWVDTRARGTRTGPMGKSAAPTSSKYLAPPESMSFTFDNDGFCVRMTAAAVTDPLLGNTGLLGGVYGLLYATETPENPLKTRTLNLLLNRAQKAALKAITKAGVDEYRLSDGRIVSGSKPVAKLPPSSSFATSSLPSPPKLPPPSVKDTTSKTPFFAAPKTTPTISLSTKATEKIPSPPRPKAATVSLPKTGPIKSTPAAAPPALKPEPISAASASKPKISDDPQDPVTEAFSSFFGTSEVTSTASITQSSEKSSAPEDIIGNSKVDELRKAAEAARREAAEAKQKAAAKKASLEEKKVAPTQSSPSVVENQGALAPAKRSPTLSIFGASPAAAKSAPKAKPVTPSSSAPKKSPTFSIFGSSTSASMPMSFTSTQKTTAPSPTPTKFPTLSLFGSTPLAGSTPVSTPSKVPRKSVPKGSVVKKAQTFSIAGVGGGSTVKPASKNKSKGLTKEKKMVKAGATTAPTFGLFQGAKESKSATTKGAQAKPAASKSPSFSLFGGSKSSSNSAAKEAAPSQQPATKSPSFSLFQDAEKSKASPAKPKPAATEKQSKSKASSTGSSFLGSIFGGTSGSSKSQTSSETSKSSSRSLSPTTKNSNPVKTPQSTAGIPTLKNWKVNTDNSVEGRIFGSSSFKDGATVSTSPIGKKFDIAKGNVVQTSSGSKYLLE